ncbi:Na+/H+ antiporter subunit D [Psychrobacillus sp. FSL K6-2684]|uniref:Na+/H+ antiporter subunit D n=1 Tax=Psychrobacillus faecigallinarum TaxID=2762235 RepID=A0ABR8RBZ6_9BACI|nr:Na+/H+ antiporter subunit D [Psychrobacillus faecigallinarum]MBD7945311.1 Na+/H+ antiporter subunit D [Psychrobacillus faecigallinarum]QGM32277.1 Na+/H+ antiporter subunit D [Bacillus sp. N3536]
MNNIIVLPLIIPIMIGVLLVFFNRYIKLQRIITLLTVLSITGISVFILNKIQLEGILRLDFGGWKPPFGILFVADSFSVLLVLTASIVTALCVMYAFSSIGERHEKMYFYPFVLFLLAGVNGSFLTGDMFNLFVCFEVTLLASYVLITLGGTKRQLRESIKYVVINVIASWFFLLALAYLYGSLGTLNMAHLSERVAEAGQDPLLTTIGILFLVVFSIKAGLLLFFWLPGSYSAPPMAIAALFGALLTKVGIYALFRTFTIIFYHDTLVTHTIIGVMAGITLVVGCMGAIAYKDLRLIASYNVVIAVGFMLVGLAIGTPVAIEGSIYYIVHDMIAKAMLFLLVGTMISLTGKTKINEISGLIKNYPLLGWLFFVVTCSLAGIPPLSGFVGKILVGQGAIESGSYILLALAFLSSIVVLYSLLRIFLNSIFGETIISLEDETPMKFSMIFPIFLLGIGTLALGLGAEVISGYVTDAANTLSNPAIYIDAILGGEE